MLPLPIQLLLFMLAGWVSRHHQQTIEYLKAENTALREQLGERRVRFTVEQYHEEHNHQGIGNRLIREPHDPLRPTGPIECRERLGGLLRYYTRAA